MGEKKMLEKERKSPSQKKKAAAAEPKSWPHYSFTLSCSCPSLSHKIGTNYKVSLRRSRMIYDNISGMGGVTKSWISSKCRIHQTWPQLVETNNFSPQHIKPNPFPFQFYAHTRNGPNYAFFERDFRVTEPYSGGDYQYMEFTNVIGFQGKYYAISRQGSLALFEDEGDSGNFEITAFGRNRVVPRCKVSKHFREFLLEYNEKIYLVFLLSRMSTNVVDSVEVFRLDSRRLSWEKVDRLIGDAMFFVEGKCCLGISASKLGCSSSKGRNCVYFSHDRAKDGAWVVYDMETSCISPISDSLF